MTGKITAAALALMCLMATTPAYSASCPGSRNQQTCCSARACGGKILSNRDRHNCKVKSHGKSWHAKNGKCQNL